MLVQLGFCKTCSETTLLVFSSHSSNIAKHKGTASATLNAIKNMTEVTSSSGQVDYLPLLSQMQETRRCVCVRACVRVCGEVEREREREKEELKLSMAVD